MQSPDFDMKVTIDDYDIEVNLHDFNIDVATALVLRRLVSGALVARR
jgi:hypothetical protein